MSRLDWYIRANLKLRHLQLLVAMDDLGSVNRVAAYLNVTQPAVSKTLAQIEEGLELPLFERTPRGMEPTEHGACLIRHAREILGQLAVVRDELRDITEGRITRVSMGVLPATACVLVPRFIAQLEAEATDVAVNVREGTMATMLPALRAGDVDLLVGLLPERRLPVEFDSELLYEDPVVVVVRRGHPLAAARRLEWPMLSGYPMVLPPPSASTRGPIDAFMAESGVDVPRRHVESISTLTNIGVLQFTDSVGFLARDLARHFAAQGALEVLPLEVPNILIRVGLVWMVDRRMSNAQRMVRELLRETAARMPRVVADTSPLADPGPPLVASTPVVQQRPVGIW
ncbi:LysR substrate-binding domain-containing protein [Ramlibacter tataouinensis]|uniref:LysR substrate-binding domain-containing protein n=1 Tax=Ramlibacter tataouinensis TaxID=94132 RepID=UPI0022F3B12C|nr:LysR substrate-binding domain-containing protein [Ramlibacter tataouinensis]WBY00233.1 LysR substrate-binding domain-containing protein [Ramlibacter tataouinensis]